MLEFVYAVPRRALFPTCYPHGLVPFGSDGDPRANGGYDLESFRATVSQHGFFAQRDRAELDPDLKQVIPYTLVFGRDEAHGIRILCLRRTKAGGDARLHDKLSIGVGGHVEPPDAIAADGGDRDPIAEGSRRELAEELFLPECGPPRPVGMINDDTNPVGAVHVGLVQVLEVDDPTRIAVREQDVLVGELRTPDELRAMRDAGANFESWSAQMLDRLDELIPEYASGAASTAAR
ncbi:hypothetical protein [Engelhardtia mirabilis]|uniref:Nudix hydrolase domain-containing protein n=1 Tax=Engelhardtia mirabilis TaxID=2528011 RepID=A0A518BJ17_9BACT|nr:hypothetical protein Pla133_20570 [Planctomycetes bacterium Pla133]QDV01308.1 hypothetical protein Pla86_20570 [Planctomycetes bacterium Pla86]